MKISSELLQQIIKEEITQVLSEFDAANVVDFFRGGKIINPPTKEEFKKQIENFGELNRQNWKQFLCLALKTRPRREGDEKIASEMFISKLESANFDQNVSNQIFSLYAKLSQNDEQAERFCSRSKQMGDESVPQQTTQEQPRKNRKERRAEKSKRGGESQGSNGGNKVGPSQGAPKPRARRRQ